MIEEGLYYTNTHYEHAVTLTAAGHATLSTGAHPAQHGIISNDWYDPDVQEWVYNTQDLDYTVIGKEPDPKVGTSPKNLLSSTIGDEIVLANNGKSRAFGVSIKDRGAILMAGFQGKAFFFDKAVGEFVTTTYYYDANPEWLTEWNDRNLPDTFRDDSWELMYPQETYTYGDSDDRPFEIPYKHLDNQFPHELAAESDADFYDGLTKTPFGDEITLDFLKTLVVAEAVGAGDYTDYLSVSFSSTDYIGHVWGPASLEYEDNLLRLDRTLADLFTFIHQEVGLQNTLIVLSSDHGVPEAPEHMHALGMDVHRHDSSEAFITQINRALYDRFEIGVDLVDTFVTPYLFLDLDQITMEGLSLSEVEFAVRDIVLNIPGFAYAIPHSQLQLGDFPDDPIYRRVKNSFHPRRSGHVYLIPDQYWYLYHDPVPALVTGMHGTPWAYDRFVPMIFAGHGVDQPRHIHRPSAPVDIAATLAALLKVKPPSGCVGTPLPEMLGDTP